MSRTPPIRVRAAPHGPSAARRCNLSQIGRFLITCAAQSGALRTHAPPPEPPPRRSGGPTGQVPIRHSAESTALSAAKSDTGGPHIEAVGRQGAPGSFSHREKVAGEHSVREPAPDRRPTRSLIT